MLIITDDRRQLISLAGITVAEFECLGEILRALRESEDEYLRSVATGLHLPVRWILHTSTRTISLMNLTWIEICLLDSAVATWIKGNTEREYAACELLEALDTAIESILKSTVVIPYNQRMAGK